MDDLSGLDWNSNARSNPPPLKPANTNPFSTLQTSLTPSTSGRSTPLSAQPSAAANDAFRGLKVSSKPPTPANDSFSSLLSANRSKSPNTLSLQERQRQIAEEKAKKLAEQSQLWNTLGSGNSTPAAKPSTPAVEEDDVLAAFNSAAPVDASSHFPPPRDASRTGTPSEQVNDGLAGGALKEPTITVDDDDDPFGLSDYTRKQPSPAPVSQSSTAQDDDDILGMLGRPAAEVPKPAPKPELARGSPAKSPIQEEDHEPSNPRDKAVAELVDMGFPVDKSAKALAQTDYNLQAAVSLMLNQAHEEAKQKAQGGREDRGRPSAQDDRPRRAAREQQPAAEEGRSNSSLPPWMRGQESRSPSTQRRQDSGSPAPEKDVSQYASELGSNLFKSANSLWKTGQKRVQKAVAEFQQEGDSSQPKWMRDAQAQAAMDAARPAEKARKAADVTDEAMMLEGGGRPQKPSRRVTPDGPSSRPLPIRPAQADVLRDSGVTSQGPAPSRSSAQQLQPRSAAKLTREAVEEQSAGAYISPARRKKPTPKSAEPPAEQDIFASRPPASTTPLPSGPSSPPLQSNNPFAQRPTSSTAARPQPAKAAPTPPRPSAPPRKTPPINALALSESTSHRLKGTEAFKRGDYAAAYDSYSSALRPLPPTHPITIVVLSNRSLTSTKVGNSKQAIDDADAALAIIGPSRGEGEKIDLGGSEGVKDMKDFYGKVLMRKAEALEHLEKWNDAAKAWRDAVEAGVGGPISIQGRNRCEKAAAPKPKPVAVKKAPAGVPTRPPAATAASAQALKKLRAANNAAEKADDERFRLGDVVDAKLVAWKGSKADNIQALLASLDKVLWPEAGWNKVGLQDLIMPNKVKINYMKAIAKVHPDKIPQDATTEQKMISAAVFSTLNEAWDKFKKDNNL